MLLREYKEMLEDISSRKVTNTDLAKALNTSSQNISKRVKNNSELTTSELSKLESVFGVYNISESVEHNFKRRKINLSEEFSTWGTRLEKVQAVNNLSDDDMCQILGISIPLYNDIISNDSKPTIDLIKAIVENFDVDLNWLFLAKPNVKDTTNSDLINSLPQDKFQKLLKLLEN